MRIDKIIVGCAVIVLQLSVVTNVIGDNAITVSPSESVASGSSVLVSPSMQSSDAVMHVAPVHRSPVYSSGAVEHGFSPFLPSGPSGTSDLLGYMQCDPHSCPNIWAGYEAQRQADLRRKCTPHGHCGGCGHGCGSCGSGGCGAPCNSCGAGAVKNRYRHGSARSVGCGDCSGSPEPCGCDSAPMEFSSVAIPEATHAMASTVAVPSLVPAKKLAR